MVLSVAFLAPDGERQDLAFWGAGALLAAGLMVMRFLGGSSVLTPSWEKGFEDEVGSG